MKKMSSLAKNMKTLAAVVGFAAAGVATGAQAQTTQCGLTGISADQTTVTYDPFVSNTATTAMINMRISRDNLSGGATTSILNFYLKPNSATGAAANGIEIYPVSISGQASLQGVGLDIFYGTTETEPATLLPISLMPSQATKFAKISFTGNNQGSDSVSVLFQVKLPANLNLSASQSLMFDAVYGCNIQGSKDTGAEFKGERANAMDFPVVVLSALRASYVGTALDFREIGQITNAQALAGANAITGNKVRVESSGPFNVTIDSENDYKLVNSGGTGSNNEVKYQIHFLGEDLNPTNSAPLTKTCTKAGIGTQYYLPIDASLLEGGAGKNPSVTYADQLTVTVTPLAYNAAASIDCSME